jgi:hypothetical protein
MNNLEASYNKILITINNIEKQESFLPQIRKPKLKDKEVVSLVLVAEYLGIDSEYELFRKLPSSLSSLIERSVYNRRKRKLFPFIERIREKISHTIISDEEYHIIDSMPLEICKLSRKNRLKICKENFDTSPNEGFCASQQSRYYGYKLHAVCTIQGVFRSFDLSKASVHDIHYLNDVKNNFEDVVILGDKGYLSKSIQMDLFNYQNIRLEVPLRKNQIEYKPQTYILRKSRKRIETLFSQLCDQFKIRNNYAKTFEGFKTRILAKITALTVIQLINKQNNRNINNLKTGIA